MKIFKVVFALVFVAVTGFTVNSHLQTPPEQLIIGTWATEADGLDYKIVFNSDGTMHEYDGNNYDVYNWSIIDNGEILKKVNANNPLEVDKFIIHALDGTQLNIRYIRERVGLSEIAYYVKQ